jgi:integrase
MPRRSKVSYWTSRGTWEDEKGNTQHGAFCCWYKGRQHILAEGPDDQKQDGPVFNAAVKKLVALKMLDNAGTAKDANKVRVVCELFLRHVSATLRPATLRFRKKILVPFTDAFGEVAVGSLTRHAVNAWLDQMRQPRVNPETGKRMRWTDSTVAAAIGVILTAFRWAAGEGLITAVPLVGLKKPKSRSRGREALIGRTPAERAANHQRILAAATKPFRPFIIVLEATGCRPGELAAATAADFNAELGAIVYHADSNRLEHEFRHKTAGHNKDRMIFLVGESLEIVKELVRRHQTGPLFRTRNGGGWTGEEIVNRFHAIRKAVGVPRLTAYSYRHTFATAWLEQGKSVDVLAGLLGNTPAVIRKHYSHLLGDTSNLRAQLEAFRGVTPSAGGTGTPPTGTNGGGVSPAV